MPLSDTIKEFFNSAKKQNEFEFVCTLINYKGLGSISHSSNLYEWFNAIDYYKEIYAKEVNAHKKVRIGLLLYSTFFESSDLYAILGNLARTKLGWRTSPYLYWKHAKADRWYGTAEKVSLVCGLLTDAGYQSIEQFFIDNHHKELRNTFFHSTYSLEEDDYLLHDSEPIYIEQVGHVLLSIDNFIIPRIDRVITFFESFKRAYNEAFVSYKTNKTVLGAMPEEMEIQIIGSDKGLVGFIAGGSYIKLENDFWTGMNIVFDSPSEVDRFIADELKRFIAKETIRTGDGSLQHLNDVITERNIEPEKQDLATVYQRFGDMLYKQANEEENQFKKQNLYKHTLFFYNKMISLDKTKVVTNQIACVKYVVSGNGNIALKRESLNDLIKIIEEGPTSATIKNAMIVINDLKQGHQDINTEKQKLKSLLDKIVDIELKELVDEKKKELEKI